jgi:hypothetical protein
MENGKTQYRVMTPISRDDSGEPYWHRVGTAWLNQSRKGGHPMISVRLNSLPISRELVLFVENGGGAREPGSDDVVER